MSFKFVSENTLEEISLHDCLVKDFFITENTLMLKFDFINVMEYHPLNHYPVAKSTDEAILLFEDYEILKSIGYNDNESKIEVFINIEELLISDFEVLEVTKLEETKGHYTYKIFAVGNNLNIASCYCYFIIKFKKVKLCWNEFLEDAWFVNFK